MMYSDCCWVAVIVDPVKEYPVCSACSNDCVIVTDSKELESTLTSPYKSTGELLYDKFDLWKAERSPNGKEC